MDTHIKVCLSPISINRCWQGRRFKTKEYEEWRDEAYVELLPKAKNQWPEKCFFSIRYIFHVHNFLMIDVDNMIKPIQDALVEARIIPDDRMITKLEAEKIKATKGEERIEIYIEHYIP